MSNDTLSVREIQSRDIPCIIDYWLGSDDVFLRDMGVDITKIPARGQWESMLSEQLSQPYEEKKSYCMIWEVNGAAAGHSNVNKIIFGKEAFMHLHLWHNNTRKKGAGSMFVKMTLPYFFENLKLDKLYCEPYALNPAPNKTLEKTGFTFVKNYITTPGWINFEQPVNLWELSRESL